MSWKSIRFSLYAFVLFCVCVVGIIFIFKSSILFGVMAIVSLILPAMLQRKAIDEASGRIDKLIAKFIVPGLAVVAVFLAVMALAFWIQ